MTMRTSLGAELVSLNTIMADHAGFQVWYELALPRVYRYLLARCGGDADLAVDVGGSNYPVGNRDGYPIDDFGVENRRQKKANADRGEAVRCWAAALQNVCPIEKKN